jgi:hypothetical protein
MESDLFVTVAADVGVIVTVVVVVGCCAVAVVTNRINNDCNCSVN